MYELDAVVAADPHEPRFLSRSERPRVDEPQIGPPERRRPQQRLPRLPRQRSDPPRHQRTQAVRHRKTCRVATPLAPVEETRDLERVQGIAARRLSDPHEGRPREAPAQRVGDDAVERGHRQRPELEKLERPVARGGRDQRLVGALRAHGDDAQHRLVLDPPERELDRRCGRRVEPLEVVDRDGDECSVRGEPTEHGEERGADEPSLGRTAGGDSQERDVECLALRRRQARQGVLGKMPQEIGEAGERQSRLGLRRPGDEHGSRRLRAPLGRPRPRRSSYRCPARRRSRGHGSARARRETPPPRRSRRRARRHSTR